MIARHVCVSSPLAVAEFSVSPRGNADAEWVAGEQRAAGHPEAHVHVRPGDVPRDDRFVVIVDGGAS